MGTLYGLTVLRWRTRARRAPLLWRSTAGSRGPAYGRGRTPPLLARILVVPSSTPCPPRLPLSSLSRSAPLDSIPSRPFLLAFFARLPPALIPLCSATHSLPPRLFVVLLSCRLRLAAPAGVVLPVAPLARLRASTTAKTPPPLCLVPVLLPLSPPLPFSLLLFLILFAAPPSPLSRSSSFHAASREGPGSPRPRSPPASLAPPGALGVGVSPHPCPPAGVRGWLPPSSVCRSVFGGRTRGPD